MTLSPKLRFLIVVVAFIGSFLFDHFWITKHAKILSDLLKVEFEFKMPGLRNFTIPQFGVIPVLFLTLFIYTLTIIPYRKIRDKRLWSLVIKKIKSIFIWLVAIPVFMLVGALLYLIFKSIFPETATRIAEAFSVTTSFFVINTEKSLMTLEGSVASLLGLITGLYFLSKKLSK